MGGKKLKINVGDIEKIKNFLVEKLSPLFIFVFGSVVDGNFRKDSDIDIAFLSQNEISSYEVFMIAQELASILSRDIDLIDFKKASTVFKAQIVGKGEVIYLTDGNTVDEFMIRALKEYALLNEERAVILDRIKEEETIYDDVILNKTANIERCIKRIHEEYENNPENLKNYTKQDSIILNIQRACVACIDVAMHLVSIKKFGVPQNSRDAFDLLYQNNIISEKLKKQLVGMVGFRNIAVHNYQEVVIEIIQKIIEKHLQDLLEFKKVVLAIK